MVCAAPPSTAVCEAITTAMQQSTLLAFGSYYMTVSVVLVGCFSRLMVTFSLVVAEQLSVTWINLHLTALRLKPPWWSNTLSIEFESSLMYLKESSATT
jgi:hypothetical protein